ncbi:MAG: phosphoribosylglycinamide formyltransferase [Salinisphaera sp.]|nr:phosphoribosylglycinamide formyltransferase [Salinisphaera sp.]
MTPAKRSDGRPARLVVVISGRGRNLAAIMRAIDDGRLNARITLVVSNNGQAPGLQKARLAGIGVASIDPAGFADRKAFDEALATRIAAEKPDWIVLAGYMRILGSAFVQRFAPRIINIHPSLLPRHKGLHTHKRAIEAGDTRHGASVHIVTAELDGGPVFRQGSIAIAADDTPDTLADRVMSQVEEALYPAALHDLISGRVRCSEHGLVHDGQPLTEPLHENYD